MKLIETLQSRFGDILKSLSFALDEVTIEVSPRDLKTVAFALRDEEDFRYEMLMDLAGVDYLHYGFSEWETEMATNTGFSRGVEKEAPEEPWSKPRFAVVYHLLSLSLNQRLRLKCFAETDPPIVPSLIEVWNSANWYEREAFDLFGIFFDGHPDLRRILTDYGFIGHPFRKDFPLIGKVEVRYSAAEGRVVYQPVTILPRTLVPKTIRDDNRYE